MDPSLCPHYIPQATHQDNNNNFNLQSLNPLSPRPGATPIAGPGQGSQATYRLPTGQGFRPNEATQIVCKLDGVVFSFTGVGM